MGLLFSVKKKYLQFPTERKEGREEGKKEKEKNHQPPTLNILANCLGCEFFKLFSIFMKISRSSGGRKSVSCTSLPVRCFGCK